MSVLEALDESECYLWAILSDPSGLDQAEFSWTDMGNDDFCFRAWPYQWKWWRDMSPQQIDQCGRSVGKSLSIKVRAFAFPFIHPGQEMVITAPEGNHLDAITDVIETAYLNTRLGREMLATGRRGGITHRPFHMNFANGSRIMGRIPQRDGKGVKGCGYIFTPIPTLDGIKFAKDVKVGDKVLTHEGRWSEVLYVEHDVNDCYKVEGAGSFPMIVSCDHRFMGASNLATPKQKRKFGPMYFEDVELLLDQQFYWATPTKFPYIEPEYPEFNNHSRPYNVESEEFWWLVGLYVADGYLRKNGKGDSDKCINWISHPKNKGRAKLIRNLERLNFTYRITKRDHSSGDQVEVSSRPIADWLNKHIGRTATTKTLPMFMLSLPDSFKEAFLDGYLSGDGYWNESKGRWEAGSASKNLMIMIQLIAQSIGLTVGCTSVEPNVAEVNGKSLKKKPETSWRIYISDSGHAFKIGDYLVNKVKKITPVGKLPVVNIITDDHSYLSGSVMSHNIHPIWLELDEAQDYPDAGWIEIFETVKQGHEGAMWRAHGVTRGLRDYFYKFTQPDSGWSVHRYCLPGDTLVYGVDGPVPIAEIEPGTDVWAINEKGQLVTEQVTALIPNGKKVIWEVKTKGGYALRSTGNHPYLRLSNYGTRKTRRELRFEWVNAEDLKPGDYVVCVRDLPDVADPKPIPVSAISKMLQSYSVLREIPQSVWRASKETKIAFLCGYLMGDGSQTKQKSGQTPWSIGTSSYKMAKQLRALAHYCGLRCSAINVNDSVTQILANSPQYRFYVYPEESWFNQIPNSYTIHDLPLGDEFVVRRVSSVRNTGIVEETYDISVGENHNFVAEGMVVHNTGMHRPTWTDEERQNQIAKYGSRDHPDYRRNVLGLHGDTTNPLFVLHRLMACVDTEVDSVYNTQEYYYKKVNNEMVLDAGDEVLPWLEDIPRSHIMNYKNFWIGMDVGYTNDPSAIVVFAETQDKKTEQPKLKMLSRILLERIKNPHQVEVIMYLLDIYRPRAFSMDKTGVGLPLYQDLQERLKNNKARLETIKGYNFSSKILVDFDQTIEIDDVIGDPMDAKIERNVLEYSSDKLRQLVDQGRIILPYDKQMISEFQLPTWTANKSGVDMYGRKKTFSKGSFHTLDATRMCVLGYVQYAIEEMTKEEKFVPAPTIFLEF